MQGQQHHAFGGSTDQRARGQMRTDAGSGPAVTPPRKMIKIMPPQLILFIIGCRPRLQGPTTDRGLNRELGADPDAPPLPTPASEVDTLGQSPYDTAPWSRASLGFRNRLEGWLPFGMHNQVHVE